MVNDRVNDMVNVIVNHTTQSDELLPIILVDYQSKNYASSPRNIQRLPCLGLHGYTRSFIHIERFCLASM